MIDLDLWKERLPIGGTVFWHGIKMTISKNLTRSCPMPDVAFVSIDASPPTIAPVIHELAALECDYIAADGVIRTHVFGHQVAQYLYENRGG